MSQTKYPMYHTIKSYKVLFWEPKIIEKKRCGVESIANESSFDETKLSATEGAQNIQG